MSFSFSGNINLSGKDISGKSITSKRSSATGSSGLLGNGGSNKNAELTVGSKISGEIVKIDNDSVLIALDNDNVIAAKLEKAINLALNSKMIFEICTAKDNKIYLRPLLTNTSQASMIMEALKSAGIHADENTMNIVGQMIDRGMSIDKQSLLQMNRYVNEYSDTDINKLLDMKQLNIPVNDINVEKFDSYLNMRYQINNTADELSDALSQDIKSMLQNGGEQEATGFVKAIIDSFKSVILEGIRMQVSNKNELSEAVISVSEEAGKGETVVANVTLAPTADFSGANPDRLINAPLSEDMNNGLNLSDSEANPVKLNTGENILPAMETKPQNVPVQNNLLYNNTLLAFNKLETILNDFINSPSDVILDSLEETVKSLLKETWSINPEVYLKDGAAFVKELNHIYQSMLETARTLNENLEAVTKSEGRLKESSNNLKNNITFLSDLNQSFTYMQIPLHLSNNYKNSELYVYSRKKNLTAKEGELTAFLHLDMENLGPVDIKVSLLNNNIKTKFILKDEETIAFIEENMHFLNNRLHNKGYNVDTEYENMETEFNVVHEMKIDAGISTPQSLYQYSFDVRA